MSAAHNSVTLLTDMLEYFLFSFAHTPLLVGEFFARAEAVAGGVPAVGPNTNGRQKSHPFYRLSTLSKEQNMVGDRTLEKTPYTETLRSFLAFFLPLVSPASAATGAEEEESLSSMQQKPITLTTKNNQDGSTLPKDIYACR